MRTSGASVRVRFAPPPQVDGFQAHLPLISALRNQGMRKRHWERLSAAVGFELEPGAGFSVSRALELGLQNFLPQARAPSGAPRRRATLPSSPARRPSATLLRNGPHSSAPRHGPRNATRNTSRASYRAPAPRPRVTPRAARRGAQGEAVGEVAAKEFALERALDKMQGDWTGVVFAFSEWRETKTYILKGLDDIQMLLDDQIVKTQSMRASPNIGPFEDRVRLWERKLNLMQEILDAWLACQQARARARGHARIAPVSEPTAPSPRAAELRARRV